MTPDLTALETELQRDPSSRRFGELAREYQRLGRLDEARNLCETGLLKHPTQWQARLLLAQVYLAQGRLEDARGCVEKILLALPENLQANHLAADIYLALGERAKALKHYQVVDLFEPGRPGVGRAIAELTAEPVAPGPEEAFVAPASPAPIAPAEPESVGAPVGTDEPQGALPETEDLFVADNGPGENPETVLPCAPQGVVSDPVRMPIPQEPLEELSSVAVPVRDDDAAEDFIGTIKIPTWTAEPDLGTALEDLEQTAPQPVLSAEESSFQEVLASGQDDQLGAEFLDAHEQTLTELPKVAAPSGDPAQQPPPGPLPPAAPPLSTEQREVPALSTTTLAVLYAEQGYPEKAIEVYQRVLLQDPERADVKRKIQELMQRISGEAPELPDVHQEDVRRALRQRRVQVLEGWLRRVREERHV